MKDDDVTTRLLWSPVFTCRQLRHTEIDWLPVWPESRRVLMPLLTTWQPRLVLMYGQHFCLFCCNTEATFCTVDQDCQPDRENGKKIPTLLIQIDKVVSRINKVVSRINKVVSRIVEGVDPNQQGGTPNQQSVSRILYDLSRHILIFWVLSHFEFLSSVTFWASSHIELCPFWVGRF